MEAKETEQNETRAAHLNWLGRERHIVKAYLARSRTFCRLNWSAMLHNNINIASAERVRRVPMTSKRREGNSHRVFPRVVLKVLLQLLELNKVK